MMRLAYFVFTLVRFMFGYFRNLRCLSYLFVFFLKRIKILIIYAVFKVRITESLP